eukprot:15884432-Heterocapsa_arctica.AAC.1
MAIGLSCPSFAAPSLGINAMIGFKPCGHFLFCSTLFRICVSPLMCVLDSALSSAGLHPSTPFALPAARLLTTRMTSSS